ncbi:DUF1822 family protein [Nostoc sp.]|uniref:DUF1822 family protein n=1 Tax=Nostoc sp. TaxID=1180 RepID=UPI002FF52EE0
MKDKELIMKSTIQNLHLTVSLALEAHNKANEYLKRHKSNPQKAKQIYLNTLVIYAVVFYLHCRGYQTDWKASDSADTIMQSLMDVADLVVKGYGKIECRPVLPNSETMYVPQEAWSDRICYVAVQLDESLREATILGFVEKVETENVSLSELRSLDDFPFYLNQFRQFTQQEPIQIKQWANRIFQFGWQGFETIAGSLNPESLRLITETRGTQLRNEAEFKATKSIDLGTKLGDRSISIIVAYTNVENEKISIRVQIYPTGGETYLPSNLQLILLDESGEIKRQVPSRSLDNYIQLPRFECIPGEKFSIKITLDDFTFTEEFFI